MSNLLKGGAPDHREVGHELARRSGVDMTRARKGVARLEARGLVLIALVRGEREEVARIMAHARGRTGKRGNARDRHSKGAMATSK